MYFKPHSIGALLGLLCLTSCSLQFLKEDRSCYRDLKKFTKDYWHLTHSDSLLLNNAILEKEAMGAGRLQSCIIGLTSTQIAKLFGTPHNSYFNREDSSKINQLFYYTSASCYQQSGYCRFYVFEFNGKEKCIGFATGDKTVSH